MNWRSFAKDYGLFAVIIVVALFLFPPYLTAALGPVTGTYTSYIATGIVAMGSLWIFRKMKRNVD